MLPVLLSHFVAVETNVVSTLQYCAVHVIPWERQCSRRGICLAEDWNFVSVLWPICSQCSTKDWKTENSDEFWMLLGLFFLPLTFSSSYGYILFRTVQSVLQLISVSWWPLGADLTQREVSLALPQPHSFRRFICIQRIIRD